MKYVFYLYAFHLSMPHISHTHSFMTTVHRAAVPWKRFWFGCNISGHVRCLAAIKSGLDHSVVLLCWKFAQELLFFLSCGKSYEYHIFKENYKECSILRSQKANSYLLVICFDHLYFLYYGSVHPPVPVAHISDERKLPAPETLWEGRLGLLAFVYVAVDTTGRGWIQS